jgi:hypothetical protein
MTTAVLCSDRRGILRHSRWDALLVALAAVQGLLLVLAPAAPVIALGLWWNSNTIAHNFIHRPFFRARWLNRLFALYQSVLLGVPQSLWRDRHLAHHAGIAWHLRIRGELVVEGGLVLSLWTFLLVWHSSFFLTVYLPAYGAGLGLCWLHGYYEHARGTTSHHGWLYNLLFFNDGYHVEHHGHPGTHWTELPQRSIPGTPVNRWPAVLRWLDVLSLETLERWVLRFQFLQVFVSRKHERAFRRLLAGMPAMKRVGIVGGGLFPRTYLICRRLWPDAELVVIDASAANLQVAQAFLADRIPVIHAWYDPALHTGFDLLVVPLAFVGDRTVFYQHPPAPLVLIHDWLWRRHRPGAIVSLLLAKRLNLVKQCEQRVC